MSKSKNIKLIELMKLIGYNSTLDICEKNYISFHRSLNNVSQSLSFAIYKESENRNEFFSLNCNKKNFPNDIYSIDSLLTLSSESMLEMASSKFFPLSVLNPIDRHRSSSVSFSELNEIDYFSDRLEFNNLNLPLVRMEQETDEVKYLSHILFQNIMMKEFQRCHTDLSSRFGDSLRPNDQILAMNDGINSVESVYNDFKDYFSDNMVMYISSILQNEYSKMEDVPVSDRIAYNSWDMIHQNSMIELAEKGADYKLISEKLYAISSSYCQDGVINPYKENASFWANELIKYYSDDIIIDSLISELKVQGEYDIYNSSFKKVIDVINNTINKVHILNTSSGNDIPEQVIQDFEYRLYGSVISGFSLSMNWGEQNTGNSVLWNRKNFDETVKILKYESKEQSSFWSDFFSRNLPEMFWNDLNSLGLKNYTIRDEDAYNKIISRYPELGSISRTNTESFLSTFSFILSVGHFAWATTTGREETTNPLPYISLGAAFIETTLNYSVATLLIAKYFVTTANIEIYETGFIAFSKFISSLCSEGRLINNVSRVITKTIFSSTEKITEFVINTCFVGLSILTAALATYDLINAIANGDLADIIFSSINMIIAGSGLIYSIAVAIGVTSLGPIGIVIAIVGILVAVAQWIYELLKKPKPPISPIQQFTITIMKQNNYIHKDVGNFLCLVKGNHQGHFVCPFNTQTMNTDWINIPHLIDNANKYPNNATSSSHSMVTSERKRKVYNFSNMSSPTYCYFDDFFKTGTDKVIDKWLTPYDVTYCISAVESISMYKKESALFFASRGQQQRPSLYLTDGLECSPSKKFTGINDFGDPINEIVGINNLSQCTFIVFTQKNIYQITDGNVKKVVENYHGGTMDNNTYPINVHSVFVTGDIINVIYDIYGDAKYYYHKILQKDDNEEYNSYYLLNVLEKKSPYYNLSVGIQYPDDRSSFPRISYYTAGGDKYSRNGVINTSFNTMNSLINFYVGVNFTVPNNGFITFYKNAFLPN
ncbi:hypothetical protein ID854_02320 [Xenorhabdus sp. M]|uniref:Uncharacterized protein n=1 Tax=Xenorhabdus szentirmaii TaxID=290112 RepID=A0AAW3YQN8_9GAMM|nr:hypothetical protein [Xenorhabdus sp. M]MBD2799326.1 hypothetical protein [Xenorhabdus sp. M]